MDLQEYQNRLKILLEQKVISQPSHDIALEAFKEIMSLLNKSDIEQAEMLFTHLPMALSRIESGEKVDNPTPELMQEVEQSKYFQLAEEQLRYVEDKSKKPLPQGEKEYLLMHYSTVLDTNYKEEK
ncbi:PRD domain-containing protein [Radiobacillus kanasensis]|uniref:PRD domain-containing protein n=1 Tax=Radiobacillus kanasensis TaxID=2844358 RepID=UPI001E600016|nr:PRD domain-containing protein [Radiobacillus kanasensis]UFU00246.1 PRD domain-containing protein [Radiobacillus kanasensis]